jgi:hypothetical protein
LRDGLYIYVLGKDSTTGKKTNDCQMHFFHVLLG